MMKVYKAVHERENKCKELHKEMNMNVGPTRLIQPDFYLLVDVDDLQKQVNTLENEVHRMKRVEARRKWRYGRKKYAGYKDGKIVAKSKFGLNKMQYKGPDGLLYPVVAAFRSLLVKNRVTGKYEWKNGVGPIDVWDNNKEDLANKIMNFAASIGDNPNAVGKDSNIWDLAYMTIMLRNMP